ncbi:Na+/H+ antiporter [Actinobacillus pleuropneumoniae]|nr:Na+/H+ antiporter [Actinobacillus pleuropneumoniae]
MNLIDYSSSLLSIIPASLALLLAMVTRRVLLSLSVGILVGAFMLSATFADGFVYLKNIAIGLVYADGEYSFGKVQILIFLLLLGVFTSLLTYSGSNQAFANWAKKHIKGRRGAKLLTACLVFRDVYRRLFP